MAVVTAPRNQAPSRPATPHERPIGMWVVVGVPALLILFLVWQVVSPMLHTAILVRSAVAVSKVTLEADPVGSRVDLVLVDRVGGDTTVNGDITIQVREPDGAVWQTTRSVTADSFGPLRAGGLLAGRSGYSMVVPAIDWARAPRRGGAATVTVSVQPIDGDAFSTVAEERFP